MSTPAATERLAGLLAEHSLHQSMNICLGCDWRPVDGGGSLNTQHRAHVVAILAGFVAEARAEAWSEGYDDAGDGRLPATNPYLTAPADPERDR